MSQREIESCLRKARFADYRAAIDAARRRIQEGARGNIQPYECRFCGGFHIGHGHAMRINESELDANEARFYAAVNRWKENGATA